MRFTKSIIAGGVAALTDLIALFMLTDVLHIYYVVSACIAFALAILVNFSLQRFWVFEVTGESNLYTQSMKFIALSLANLAVNTFGVFLLVSRLGLWYIAAQILITVLLISINFYLYKHHIF